MIEKEKDLRKRGHQRFQEKKGEERKIPFLLSKTGISDSSITFEDRKKKRRLTEEKRQLFSRNRFSKEKDLSSF
jgi:hypothetical protein